MTRARPVGGVGDGAPLQGFGVGGLEPRALPWALAKGAPLGRGDRARAAPAEREREWAPIRLGMKMTVVVAAVVWLLAACSPAPAQPGADGSGGVLETRQGRVVVERVATGLVNPWGMVFLPDGRMLVTERPGRLRIVEADGTLSEPLTGVPEVQARNQGGLLDVALDPGFAENGIVYLSYSKPAAASDGAPAGTSTTALGRGRLVEGGIEGFEDVFVQRPWVASNLHFGSRIVFRADGTMFLTLSERFQFDPAQDLSNTLGKVVRINPDGSIPQDNPFVGQDGVDPAIWSYGHRNIQAGALHPETGELWIVEFGPMGGDELNRPEAGKNYGWPLVSWGNHYDGRDIADPPTRPELVDAVRQWTPVFSPSGMCFYTGEALPAWRNSAFVGGLSGHCVMRLKIVDGEVVEEEKLPMAARIREVEQGVDGFLYLLTDKGDGEVWRVRGQ